ncbi:MAG: hypothetical protein LBC74_04125 [Planctomycetaceae bacterium]|jgi:hypothetical protein|nr:hypothetical protein [Planctomycetaceae bacterium]
MNEDWREISGEKFTARQTFITNIFSEWKKCLCTNMYARTNESRFKDYDEKIQWRTDIDGTKYSPVKVCSLYFYEYRPKMRNFMNDPNKLLDRHKIVALTQKLLFEHYPISLLDSKPFSRSSPPMEARTLNVSFAYYFSLQFLGSWNKELYEKKYHKPFDSDSLFAPLASTEFAREHHKFLMTETDGSFPAFLIAQLWFALEQWGLTAMKK